MQRCAIALLAMLLAVGFSAAPADAAEHRLGLGIHYWKTVDDLVGDGFDELEEDGFSFVLSYKAVPKGLLSVGVDLEHSDGFGGSTDTVLTPIVWVYAGKSLYVGAGAGVNISDSFEGNTSDVFWAGRIGLDFHLLPRLRLDLNANYRAGAFDELDELATDAITLGAIARWTF